MKKSPLARELANTFPSWSKVSNDEQSLGFQLLNSVAIPMERMEKSLIRMRDNQYLTTANLNEIDIIYKVELSSSFSWDTDTSDPTKVSYIDPTVSGYSNGHWYSIYIAPKNNLENFWYESVPNRVTLDETVTGINTTLIDTDSSNLPVSGEYYHHLTDGGNIWVETTSGQNYIENYQGVLQRAQVILEGETRKGTYETESIVFPWDMKQSSKREWKRLDKVTSVNLDDGINVTVKTSDFNSPEYIDFWNLSYSNNRKKIDEFWDIGTADSGSSLQLLEYVTDDWQQLILGFNDKQVKKEWELLDSNMQAITISDIALEPYSDRIWAIDNSNLYCFSTEDTMPSNLNQLSKKTPGSQINIDMEFKEVIYGENIEFLPWHSRPLKEIKKYRIYYQTPSGTKYGLSNGASVAFTTDFWVTGITTISRTIENLISIQALERGEYIFTLEVVYIDDTTEYDQVIACVKYKQPLVKINLSSLISQNITGIEFSSDQDLWVRTTANAYKIGLHTDIMLIDYENKIIYFKEEYSTVGVETSG